MQQMEAFLLELAPATNHVCGDNSEPPSLHGFARDQAFLDAIPFSLSDEYLDRLVVDIKAIRNREIATGTLEGDPGGVVLRLEMCVCSCRSVACVWAVCLWGQYRLS